MIIFHAKISMEYLAFLCHEYNNGVFMFIEGKCVRELNVIWHEVLQEKRDNLLRCNNLPCLEKLA